MSTRPRLRAFLICATLLFAVTTIVLRKTVFGLSVTKVDPTRFDGTQAMADRLRELALGVDPNRVYSEQVPIYALLARYFTDIKEPPDDKSRILLEAKAAEKALQKGDAEEAVSGFLRVRTAASAHPELFDAQFHHAQRHVHRRGRRRGRRSRGLLQGRGRDRLRQRAGILEQRVVRDVAGEGAAHDGVDVLVA
ncbi:MAG: hypothetical protein ACXVCV_23625, partial [Polyangia bacterium]